MTALNLNKGGTNYTAPLTLPPGTAGVPPLQWTDAGLGIWQSGTATLSVVVGGTSVMDLSSSGVVLTGTLTPDAIVGHSAPLTITGLDASSGSAGGAYLTGGAATATAGTGGPARLIGGAASGTAATAGAVQVTGGAATAATGSAVGGSITITGGATAGATGAAGNVAVVGGAATGSGAGGSINLTGGASGTGSAGEVQIAGNSSLSFATYYFTGTPAATDQVFFLATRAMRVKTVSQVHSVAAGGTSTLIVTKDTSTNAPGAGTTVLTGSFNLNGTANTVQTGTLSATGADLALAAGDRLAVKFANSIQSTAGLVVTVGMQPI